MLSFASTQRQMRNKREHGGKGKPRIIISKILGCHHAEGLESDRFIQKQEDLDSRKHPSELKTRTNSSRDIFTHKERTSTVLLKSS